MKIGELATQTGVGLETIRHCEREGLLPPPTRSQRNDRVYGDADVQPLSLIRHSRSMDMSLQEICTPLHFRDNPLENCGILNGLTESAAIATPVAHSHLRRTHPHLYSRDAL